MSSLRAPSITKMLRASSSGARPLRCLSTTPSRRLNEPDPKAVSNVQATKSTQDPTALTEVDQTSGTPVETYHPRHQPDYKATIDHATGSYSLIPRRVMNGSEPTDITPAAVLSGAPVDLQARTVRIYQPAKPASQSGTWGSHHWRMDWDVLSKGHRWENPLMGWQASADCMQGTHLNFKSKEEAITFAEKQGYEFYVQEPQRRRFVPKAYANNFLHEPGPLKHIKTK